MIGSTHPSSFKNHYIHSLGLEPGASDMEPELINLINLGIPLNIIGMGGCGKSTLLKRLVETASDQVYLLEDETLNKQIKEKRKQALRKSKQEHKITAQEVLSNYNTIDKTVILIKLHEFGHTYYLFRILCEIIVTLMVNENTHIDYGQKLEVIEEYLEELASNNYGFKRNLSFTREIMQTFKGRHVLTLIIDDVNDYQLLLKYSSKINKLFNVFNEMNQGYVLVSCFSIKNLYSLKLNFMSHISEWYFPYHFPNQLLEEEIFNYLKVEEISVRNASSKKAGKEEENDEESGGESSITADFLLELREENENIEKKASNIQLMTKATQDQQNKATSIKKAMKSKSKKPKKISQQQIFINSTTEEYIKKSLNYFKVFVFNYNEFLYFYRNYTECLLSLNRKEIDNNIESYFRGTYIHFTTSNIDSTAGGKISPLENFDIYIHLLEKNSEDLKLNLSLVQKLFLYSTFLSAHVEPHEDLNVFMDGYNEERVKKRAQRKKIKKLGYMSEMSLGSSYKLGLTGSIKKKQNMMRVMEIFRVLLKKITIPNKRAFPKKYYINYLVKGFKLQFYLDIEFLFNISFLFKKSGKESVEGSNYLGSLITVKNDRKFFDDIADYFGLRHSEFISDD